MGIGIYAQKRPLPARGEEIVGTESAYRLRVSDYRLVYRVEQKVAIVEIILVGHRRDVYR